MRGGHDGDLERRITAERYRKSFVDFEAEFVENVRGFEGRHSSERSSRSIAEREVESFVLLLLLDDDGPIIIQLIAREAKESRRELERKIRERCERKEEEMLNPKTGLRLMLRQLMLHSQPLD